MKLSIRQTAPFLSKVINASFTTGFVPDMLKIAKICPIFKNGDKCVISNYRPISLLPSFSKIYEKLVYVRLLRYLDKLHILNDCQFGFRSNRSTSMAVLEMTEKISDAIENNQFAIGVFVDLSKAFDTLDHSILLAKLQFYGIRGIALDWFKSYLCNRNQFVCFNGYSSTYLPITCGVPQGSILGPLLFLIYINDICNIAKMAHIILFADDTNIFLADHNLYNLICNINKEVDLISKWFQMNKLSLNVSKTNFVLFKSPKKSYNNNQILNQILINGLPIKQVHSAKFLGVYVDEHLSWSDHVDTVKEKISKTCGILSKLKYRLPQCALINIYNSLILPYLNYCAIVWANCSQYKLNSILILQKRAVRNLCHLKYLAHTAPYFKSLKLLKIFDIYTLQVCQFMFKVTYNLLPPSFIENYKTNSDVHCYNTRKSKNYHILSVRTTKRSKSLTHNGPRIWNSLSNDIKLINSLPSFSKSVISSLLNTYN
jgi:hypothetical protein